MPSHSGPRFYHVLLHFPLQIWMVPQCQLVFSSQGLQSREKILCSLSPERLDAVGPPPSFRRQTSASGAGIEDISLHRIQSRSYHGALFGAKEGVPALALTLLHNNGDVQVYEYIPTTRSKGEEREGESKGTEGVDGSTSSLPPSAHLPRAELDGGSVSSLPTPLGRTPLKRGISSMSEAPGSAAFLPGRLEATPAQWDKGARRSGWSQYARFVEIPHSLITRPPARLMRVAEPAAEKSSRSTYRQVVRPGPAFPSPHAPFRHPQLQNLSRVSGWDMTMAMTADPAVVVSRHGSPLLVRLLLPDLTPGPGPGHRLSLLDSEGRAGALTLLPELNKLSPSSVLGQRPSPPYPARAICSFSTSTCPFGLVMAQEDRIVCGLLPASHQTSVLASTATARVTRVGASMLKLQYLRWGSRPVTRGSAGSESIIPSYVACLSRPVRIVDYILLSL